MTTLASVTARAHAKINLSLRVVGRRADGFHELKTIFQTLALHDSLSFVQRPGPMTIECNVPGVPTDSTNLVWRAAVLLWRVAGRSDQPRDLAIRIDKRIPVAGGLGGGSADAAVALMSLVRVWKLPDPDDLLPDVAAGLGADVSFFLTGGTALGLERGDEVYPLPDLPRLSVVLVLPGFGVSTAEAYGWYDQDLPMRGARESREARASARGGRIPGAWPCPARDVINDLQRPVAKRHPAIDDIVGLLRESGGDAAAMSGSGSTVFGLFSHSRRAGQAAEACRRRGWQAIVTSTLGRDAYLARTRPILRRGRNLSGGLGVV